MKNETLKLYVIENGSFLSPQAAELRQQIYELWRSEWQQIYIELGSKKILGPQDFMEYSFFNCITSNGKVVAMTSHKFFNLNDPLTTQVGLLGSLDASQIQKIKDQGVQHLMTFESLLVHPDYRNAKEYHPFGKVMACTVNALYSQSNADAIIGAARTDLKVAKLTGYFGYEIYSPALKFRIFECDMIIMKKRHQEYPQETAWHLWKDLWSQRQVFANTPYLRPDIQKENKKAA